MRHFRSARLAVLLSLAAGATAVLVGPPVAHAAVPDCTDADRSNGSGLQIANGQASITFTLARDCAIGLTAYEVQGSNQTKFATAVANTAGTHTLTVPLPPCFQVDFHPGSEHNRGEGRAIRWAKDCNEQPATPTTTAPSNQPPPNQPLSNQAPPNQPPNQPPSNPSAAPTTTVTVLSFTAAAPVGELPATGSRLASSTAVALIGLGLGLAALAAGSWCRRRVLAQDLVRRTESGGEANR